MRRIKTAAILIAILSCITGHAFSWSIGDPYYVNYMITPATCTNNDFVSFTSTCNIPQDSGFNSSSFALASQATQWVTSGSNIYYSTGKVGIGGDIPAASLASDTLVVRKDGAASISVFSSTDTLGQNVAIVFNRSGGTVAAPTNVKNGMSLGWLGINGYNGSAYEGARRVIFGQATEDWTLTAGGYDTRIYSRLNGTVGTPSLRVHVTHDGNTQIGDGGTTNYIQFASNGKLTLFGTAKVIEQEKIPATSAAKGSSAPSNVLRAVGASGTVQKPVIEFSKTIQQDIYFEFHAPYAMDITQPAHFHLVWLPGAAWTSGTYTWKLEYLIKGEGDVYNTGTPTTITQTITPADALHIIETAYPDNIVFTSDDQILICHLYLDVANSTTNTAGDVNMLEMNFTKDKQGK